MKRLLLLPFFLFLFACMHAQRPEFEFEKIFDTEGKPFKYITGIDQDETGFIWFSTLNGLYRYDGTKTKLFQNVYNDSASIPYNSFDGLFIDSKGLIWLICRDYIQTKTPKGILIFNPKLNTAKTKVFPSDQIYFPIKIIEDGDHNIWISTYQSGVHKYNPKTKESVNYCKNYMAYKTEMYSVIKNLSSSVLNHAEINHVSDFQDIKKDFTLKEKTEIMIISVGEGQNNMVDYGLLTKDKDTLWKMNRKYTRHAGGHIKNRIEIKFDTLSPGTYTLHFKTDDSHAYAMWNAPQPDVLDLYGVRIYKINKPVRESIEQFMTDVPESHRLPTNYIYDILTDDKGIVWLLTRYGLFEYEKKTETFKHHKINFKTMFTNNDRARKMLIKNNTFWFSSRKSLVKYNLDSGTHKLITDPYLQRDNNYGNFLADSEGYFYRPAYKYLHIYDQKSDTFYRYRADSLNLNFLLLDIFKDKNENLFITSYSALNKIIKIRFAYKALLSNYIHSHLMHFYIDKERNLWFLNIGKNNFSKYNLNQGEISVYSLNHPNLPAVVNDNPAHTDWLNFIEEDSRGNFWLAIANGIYKFDKDSGQISKSVIIEDTVNNMPCDIYRIYEDKGGILWLFTNAGIYLYNSENDHLTKKTAADFLLNKCIMRKNNVDAVYERNNKLWIRTYAGMYCLDMKTYSIQEIVTFDQQYKEGSHRGNIFSDDNEYIWFATYKYLFRIHTGDNQVKKFTLRENHKIVDWDEGYKYYEVFHKKDENVWVSTAYGLIKYDTDKSEYRLFTNADGLSSNTISETVTDERGLFWLATSKGISRFDPERGLFTNFEISNGADNKDIVHQYINKNKSENGNITFITAFGICSFNTNNFNTKKPRVVITNLKLYDKDFHTDTVIYKKRKLNLDYDQNFLTFEFAALDYANSKKNHFAYKLEGVDENWIYTDIHDCKAKYTELDPGTYIFRVKASNNDGVWDEEGTSLIVIISPPFWKTVWFYSLEALIGILLIYLIIKWRLRKLQKDNEKLEETVAERTVELKERNIEIEAQKDEIQTIADNLLFANEEITKQKDELEEMHQHISDSINYATRIQTSILPKEELIKEYTSDHFVLYMPKDKVSGDFYWWSHVEGQTVITAADCTGHGVPGAFMSMLGVSFLREIVNNEYITHPGVILRKLRKNIINALKQKDSSIGSQDGMDMALISIDHKSKLMQFAGANNPVYLIRKEELSNSNEMIVKSDLQPENKEYHFYELKPDRMPVAIYLKMDKYTTHEIQLNKGDCIYLLSDGFADQFGGPHDKKFKYKPIKQLLLDHVEKPMSEQMQMLQNAYYNWKGDLEQVDDIVVLGIRI